MSTFPIDLSQVPPPDVVEALGFDAMVDAWWARAVAEEPSLAGLAESDPARKWTRTGAFREGLVRQRVNDAARACMLPSAGGGDLENLAALFNLRREVVAIGDPSADPPTEDVLESDERLRRRIQLFPAAISTAGPKSAYRFHSLNADSRIDDVDVSGPGDDSAIDPGSVRVTVLPRPAGALSVDSLPAADGELLRALLAGGSAAELLGGSLAGGGLAIDSLAWQPQNRGPYEGAYRLSAAGAGAWAAGAGAGASLFLFTAVAGIELAIADATPAAGELAWNLVRNDGREEFLGGLAGQRVLLAIAPAGAWDESLSPDTLAVLAAVRSALSGEDVRPMSDLVTVQPAEIVPYRVSATLSIGSGPDPAAVLADSRARVARAAAELHALGRGAPRATLIAALHAPGVLNVNLAEPAADVAASAIQAARATAIEVEA